MAPLKKVSKFIPAPSPWLVVWNFVRPLLMLSLTIPAALWLVKASGLSLFSIIPLFLIFITFVDMYSAVKASTYSRVFLVFSSVLAGVIALWWLYFGVSALADLFVQCTGFFGAPDSCTLGPLLFAIPLILYGSPLIAVVALAAILQIPFLAKAQKNSIDKLGGWLIWSGVLVAVLEVVVIAMYVASNTKYN